MKKKDIKEGEDSFVKIIAMLESAYMEIYPYHTAYGKIEEPLKKFNIESSKSKQISKCLREIKDRLKKDISLLYSMREEYRIIIEDNIIILNRWYTESLVQLILYPERIHVVVMEDNEDTVRVRIMLDKDIDYDFLEEHMRESWESKYAVSPGDVDDEEVNEINIELSLFIDTLKLAKGNKDNFVEVEYKIQKVSDD